MGPGGAKAKGANGERELAALLTSWAAGFVELKLTRNLDQVRGGGHDLNGLEEHYGLAVEVKRVEQKAINSWWSQAVRQAEAAGCTPLLAWRQNRQPWRFRVRVHIWPCEKAIDADLEELEFRKWFLAHISACNQRISQA